MRTRSLTTAEIDMRNLAATPVAVVIPVGTVFTATNGEVPQRVTTRPLYVELSSMEKRVERVPTVYADLPRDVATSEEDLVAAAPASDSRMTRAARAAEVAGTSYLVQQAGAWIVSNDASFDTLGALVLTEIFAPSGSGERAIGEEHVAAALRVLEESGADLRDRRIWLDWQRIYDGTRRPQLRAWLREHRPR